MNVKNPIEIITTYLREEWPDLKWKEEPSLEGSELHRYEEKIKAKGLYFKSSLPRINWLRMRCGPSSTFKRVIGTKLVGPPPSKTNPFGKGTNMFQNGQTVWEACFEYHADHRVTYASFMAIDPLLAIESAIESSIEPLRNDMDQYFKEYEKVYTTYQALLVSSSRKK